MLALNFTERRHPHSINRTAMIACKKLILSACCLVLSAFQAFSIEHALPLPEVNTLAGSFAELRPNHFHGGWDFRTGGQENLPVYAFADGYVSYVAFSPGGYGKMVMINHPDGTTSLYGHLNGLLGDLAEYVKAEQYKQRSYSVMLDIPKGKFPVKAGQQFAISGNTGGSAGPHLHFETRRTADGLMLNPFIHNSLFGVVDNMRPTIYGVKIYGVPGSGLVNGVAEKKYSTNAGKATTLRQGSTVRAWGKLSFAIKASDKMNGTWFTYGIRKYRLFVDGQLVSQIHLSDFLFDDKRGINSLTDYKQRALSKEYFVKFSREPGNPLSVYSNMLNNAVVDVNEEGRNYTIAMEVEDDFGNTDRFQFIVRGEKRDIPEADKGYTQLLKQGKPNTFSRKSLLLNFPADALYTDLPLFFRQDTLKNYYSAAYDFGTDFVPIHSKFDVSVKIDTDTLFDKQKYVLCRLNEHGKVTGTIPARYVRGFMVGETNYLSRMAVFADFKAPTIFTEHILKLRQFPVLKLKIADNLSGIESYNCYIDGKWVLFEHDGKTARIFCDLRTAGLEQFKKHTLRVEVNDYCGNQGVLETSIYF